MDEIRIVLDNLPAIVESLGMIIGGFAIIATITPNEHDNSVVQKLLSLVNTLGANVGRAKNE